MLKVIKLVKTLVFSALFFVLLTCVVANASYVFRYEENANVSKFVRAFYTQEENTTDIAVVGSSAMYRFAVPTVFYSQKQYTTSLYTCAAFPFAASLDIIKEIQKTQNPDVYILDMRRFYLRADNVAKGTTTGKGYLKTAESYFSALVNNMPVSLERASIIQKVVPTLLLDNPFYWQFDYYRTHNNWYELTFQDVNDYLNANVLNSDEAARQEYALEYKGNSTVSKVNYYERPDLSSYKKTVTPTDEQISILDELRDYIKKHELNVIFVSSPFPIPEDLYAYEKYLSGYFKKNGLDYLNCNDYYDEIGIDFSTDFYDKKHANVVGAVKFTKFLADYIDNNYDVTREKLTEKQKKEWETACEKWENEVEIPDTERIKNYVAEKLSKGNTDY